MRTVSADEIAAALDYRPLVDRLREAFRAGCAAPPRHRHGIPVPGAPEGSLLLMPAWREGGPVGIKVVTVFPGNADRGLPAVNATYLLLDGATGRLRALLDGEELTLRRTAAASALAATYLARADAARLLMVGTGSLAPHLIRAHAAVRPIEAIAVWGRTPARAEALAARMASEGLTARAVGDLRAAVEEADVISCATLATDPLVHGDWLRPGQHLDLVGGFTPDMREADDEAVRRARVFVDTREGAGREAGDIVQPLARGVLTEADIAGDLAELARGERPGRTEESEITLFKSAGTALEDLAAAELVLERT